MPDRLHVDQISHPHYQSIGEFSAQLFESLKKAGVYRPDLLYTGVIDVPHQTLLRYGSNRPDRKFTFAFRETAFRTDDSPLHYLDEGSTEIDPAILVYKPEAFNVLNSKGDLYQLARGQTFRKAMAALVIVPFE